MKLRFRWVRRHWFESKPGRTGWMLYFGDEWVGGVVRYRWGTGCHPYLKANGVDRDLVEPGQAPRSPGPAKHRVEAAARALLGQRRRG